MSKRNVERLNIFRKSAGDYLRAISEGGPLEAIVVPEIHYEEYGNTLTGLTVRWEEMMDVLETQRNQPMPAVEHFLNHNADMQHAVEAFYKALEAMKGFVADGKLDGGDLSEKSKQHIRTLNRVLALTDWYAKGADPDLMPREAGRN